MKLFTAMKLGFLRIYAGFLLLGATCLPLHAGTDSEWSIPFSLDTRATQPRVLAATASQPSILNNGSTHALVRALLETEDRTTLTSVELDLSDLGLASVAMRDDGTYGDQLGSDGVYGYKLSVDDASLEGSYTLTVRGTDSRGGVHSAPLTLTLDAPGDFGAAQELVLGGIIIKADQIVTVGEGLWEIDGHATLNDVIQFDGHMALSEQDAYGKPKLQADGRLYIDAAEFGSVSLYDGAFSFDLADHLSDGTEDERSTFDIGGLEVYLRTIHLLTNGVEMSGLVKLPHFNDAYALVDGIEITPQHGVRVRVHVGVPGPIGLPSTGATLSDVYLDLDTYEEILIGAGGKLAIPNLFTLAANMTIINGGLDEIGVQLIDIANPPLIGSTPFVLTGIGGRVKGLQRPPVIVYANVSVATPPGPVHLTEIHGDVEIDMSGYFAGQVAVYVLISDGFPEGFELGNMKIEYGIEGHQRLSGFLATGEIGLLRLGEDHDGVFQGSGSFYVGHDSRMNGDFLGRLETPADTWLIGHQVFEGLTLHIDNESVRGSVHIGIAELSIEFRDGMLIPGANLEGLPFPLETQSISSGDIGVDAVVEGFQLPDGLPQVLFHATWETNTTAMELVMPDGSRLTSNTCDDVTCSYWTLDETNALVFAVNSPTGGFWQVDLTQSGQIGSYHVELLGYDSMPTATVQAPASNIVSTGIVEIAWVDHDPETTPQVDLDFVNASSGVTAGSIWTNIPGNNDAGSTLWNLDGVPSGTYRVRLTVDDGTNAPVVAYSPGTVQWTNPAEPDAPTGLVAIADLNMAHLWWTPVPGASQYLVQWREPDASNSITHTVAVAPGLSHVSIAELYEGVTYAFSVSVLATNAFWSQPSAEVELTLDLAASNRPPTFVTTAITQAVAGSVYTYAAQADDPDGQPLRYAMAAGPEKMTVDIDSGEIRWKPIARDAGSTQQVIVAALDPRGLAAIQSFEIMVEGDLDGDGVADSADTDVDGDGLDDTTEDPYPGDTDNDGIPNATDSDDDDDGLGDLQESIFGSNSLRRDSDGDGLTDGDEVLLYGSDPVRIDTDGDGHSDPVELRLRTDPADSSDNLHVSAVTAAPAQPPSISWPGRSGVVYRVQWRADLIHGAWSNTPEGSVTANVDAVILYEDTSAPVRSNGFYRVVNPE
jgi:hypothetical protein